MPIVTEEQAQEMTQDQSALAEATTPDPEEHGVTGPETDELGSPKGVVAGQEEREAEASEGQDVDDTTDEKQEEQEESKEQYEEFEITLAEDSPLSEDQFNKIMDFVEEKQLTQAEAENLIAMQEEAFGLSASMIQEQRKAEAEENRNKLMNDPEFGGNEEGFREALKVMSLPVQEFGDDGFNELLQSEIGNHPALGRFLHRLGKAMKSDTFHGKGADQKPVEKSSLERLYPSFYQKKA